ncbi:hypothetical protein DIPPA_11024 [Diplonema papillatum]|nr:hypothetical protein DIPPA_11024 [Diplonema papillatum]
MARMLALSVVVLAGCAGAADVAVRFAAEAAPGSVFEVAAVFAPAASPGEGDECELPRVEAPPAGETVVMGACLNGGNALRGIDVGMISGSDWAVEAVDVWSESTSRWVPCYADGLRRSVVTSNTRVFWEIDPETDGFDRNESSGAVSEGEVMSVEAVGMQEGRMRAASEATAVASFTAVSAGTAIGAGRLSAVMESCFETDDDLPLTISVTRYRFSGPNGRYKGCVVGNIAVLLGTSAIHLLLSLTISRCCGLAADVLSAEGLLRFPSWSFFVLIFLYQGFSSCGFTLIFYPESTSDLVLGAVTISFVTAVPVMTFAVVTKLVVPRCVYVTDLGTHRFPSFFIGRSEWVDSSPGRFVVKRFGNLFQRFTPRCAVFATVETLLSLLLGLLSAVRVTTAAQCGHKRAAMLLLMVFYTGVLVAVTPARRPRDDLCEIATMLFSSVGLAGLALADYMAPDAAHRQTATEISDVFLEIASYILLIRGLIDVGGVLYVVWHGRRNRVERRYRDKFGSAEKATEGDESDGCVVELEELSAEDGEPWVLGLNYPDGCCTEDVPFLNVSFADSASNTDGPERSLLAADRDGKAPPPLLDDASFASLLGKAGSKFKPSRRSSRAAAFSDDSEVARQLSPAGSPKNSNMSHSPVLDDASFASLLGKVGSKFKPSRRSSRTAAFSDDSEAACQYSPAGSPKNGNRPRSPVLDDASFASLLGIASARFKPSRRSSRQVGTYEDRGESVVSPTSAVCSPRNGNEPRTPLFDNASFASLIGKPGSKVKPSRRSSRQAGTYEDRGESVVSPTSAVSSPRNGNEPRTPLFDNASFASLIGKPGSKVKPSRRSSRQHEPVSPFFPAAGGSPKSGGGPRSLLSPILSPVSSARCFPSTAGVQLCTYQPFTDFDFAASDAPDTRAFTPPPGGGKKQNRSPSMVSSTIVSPVLLASQTPPAKCITAGPRRARVSPVPSRRRSSLLPQPSSLDGALRAFTFPSRSDGSTPETEPSYSPPGSLTAHGAGDGLPDTPVSGARNAARSPVPLLGSRANRLPSVSGQSPVPRRRLSSRFDSPAPRLGQEA